MPSPAVQASVNTREASGYSDAESRSDLILVTMTPEYHAFYTEFKSVPMAGELPPRYGNFLDRLNSTYGLKRVANWPLPAIGMFCIIFEIDNHVDGEAIVMGLRLEPDIESAELVQTFALHADTYIAPNRSHDPGR